MSTSMTLAFVRGEVRRTMRNRRYLIFTIVTPLALFLVIGKSGGNDKIAGITFLAYMMVSMATFGTLSAVFSTGGRISQERASGWNRQLRLTALSGRQYVTAKITTGFVVAIPSLALVLVAGATQGVHLSPMRWLAVAVSILFALAPIAGLSILIGYIAKPDSIQAIGGGIYMTLSLLGGLWSPVTDFPSWLQHVVKDLPMYWIAQAGRAALEGSWVGWTGVAVIAAWSVLFASLAARAYRRESGRA